MSTADCPQCAELRARYLDPTRPNPGAPLYLWAIHCLDDHGARAVPRPDCAECVRFDCGPVGVRHDIWGAWAATHYMTCLLASSVRLAPAS